MVSVRTNQLVGIGVGFFQHRIIDDGSRRAFSTALGFGLANQRVGMPPDLR